MSSWWLRINGMPATEIAAHSAPTWETEADGGVTSITWEMDLSRRSQNQALRVGALVEVMRGLQPVASGLLKEPDRTTWQCYAEGLGSGLAGYLALDQSTGAVTRNLGTALAYAQSIGCKVLTPSLIYGGFVASGALPGNPETVAKVADDYAAQVASRWGVDGNRVFYIRADPTAPTLMAAPGTALFGQTNEDTPKRLAGRYFNGATYETSFAGTGAPEADVGDVLIERGTLSLIEAQVVLGGMLAQKGTRAWTNGVTLHRDQLMTMGGQPANLGAIRAGADMLRAQGLAYADAASGLRLDVVIGKTRYTAGEDVIYVEPVNTVPRAPVDVWAAA